MKSKKAYKDIKKRKKTGLIILSAMVLVPLLSYGVLRSTQVQTYLGQRFAAYLSRHLETNVSVGKVDVSFFLNFVFEDVSVEDRHGEPMIFSKSMVVDVARISLRKRSLTINKIQLDQTLLGLVRYFGEEEFNFQFLVDYFTDDASKSSDKLWKISCKSLEFRESDFFLDDQSKVYSDPGFDPAHFGISVLALSMDGIFFKEDTLCFDLNRLSLSDNKGFDLKYLSGSFLIHPRQTRISNLQIRTSHSDLKLQAVLNYEGYEAFEDLFNAVDLDIILEDSKLSLEDLGYFISSTYGIKGPLRIGGRINGPVSNIRGKDLYAYYGFNTSLKGNFHLMGLPDIDETFFQGTLNEMRTSVVDLRGFRLPVRSNQPFLQLSENFANLGRLSFRGQVTGFINDMVAYGKLVTDIGIISSDILIRQHVSKGYPYYKGKLITENFDLGKFFNDEQKLGLLSLNAEVEGHGITLESVDMSITGQVERINLLSYDYRNLEIEGNIGNKRFNGSLLVDDPNLFFDFHGVVDFGEEIPVFDFNARIEQANLTALNIYQRDSLSSSVVSALLNINSQASSLDDLMGKIALDNIHYEEWPLDGSASLHYIAERILVVNDLEKDGSKVLMFRSDFVDGDINGWFSFDRLGQSVRSFVEVYLPAFYKDQVSNDLESLHFRNTSFELRFKDTSVLSDLFFRSFRLASGTVLKGNFGEEFGSLNLDMYSQQIELEGRKLVEWRLCGHPESGAFRIKMESGQVRISDDIFVDQFNLDAKLCNDSLFYLLEWENLDTVQRNHAHIEGLAEFRDRKRLGIQFLPSHVMINDSLWRWDSGNEILIDSAKIVFHNLMVIKNQEFIKASGVLSNFPGDMLNIEFHNFDVSHISHLVRLRDMNFDGNVSGTLILGSLRQSPHIEADLYVRDFAFNYDHLGDLRVTSHWDNEEKGLGIDAQVIYYGNVGSNIPLQAKGYLYPERREDNFDLDIILENLKMSVWGRYLESFASNFRGLASGRLRLEGALRHPELSGRIKMARAGLRINFLNTSYTFSDELVISRNQFAFDNVVLNDTLGNSGLISGRLYNEYFKNWKLDITLKPEQMVLLNTTQGQNDVMFYGRAFGSGQARIHGPTQNIVMDITARTNRGTQIFLPLGSTDLMAETSFITFVSKDTGQNGYPISVEEQSNLTLNFDLEVTPDAEIQLIFDSQMGDIIRGRGSGNLKMEIPPTGDFAMYGDYTIEEGDYLFTLQNIINKRFRIEQGGSIRWTGNPLDADIDLRATYRLRTTLYDLVMQLDTSDVYRRRVPIETYLILKDKLVNPTISFDIGISGGDEGTRDMLERLITTEQEMNRQVFSLLVLNRFMPTTIDQYNTALGYGVGSTSSELLSNQLSNWLSQISSDFDIGINYRPGDEISSQELEVALSTQLFNDRVIIDGNVGVAGQNPTAGNQRTSSIIGDVNVEVKITPEGKFRIKAFNRSNTFDILNTSSPYTQGIGVFYRKEFDRISEFWRRSRRIVDEDSYSEGAQAEGL